MPKNSIFLPIDAPVTHRENWTETCHGHTRTDEFAWLRADNWQEVFRDPSVLDPNIRKHLEAENAYQRALMADTETFRKTLFAEMKGRIKEDDSTVPDPDGAWAYYGEMFGWRKGETLDMGPNGVYQLFATGAQGADADGGMVLKQPNEPRPNWLYYINVASVDGALAQIKAGGGQALMGPHQVPGGAWIVLGLDPQGVAFAVVGPR